MTRLIILALLLTTADLVHAQRRTTVGRGGVTAGGSERTGDERTRGGHPLDDRRDAALERAFRPGIVLLDANSDIKVEQDHIKLGWPGYWPEQVEGCTGDGGCAFVRWQTPYQDAGQGHFIASVRALGPLKGPQGELEWEPTVRCVTIFNGRRIAAPRSTGATCMASVTHRANALDFIIGARRLNDDRMPEGEYTGEVELNVEGPDGEAVARADASWSVKRTPSCTVYGFGDNLDWGSLPVGFGGTVHIKPEGGALRTVTAGDKLAEELEHAVGDMPPWGGGTPSDPALEHINPAASEYPEGSTGALAKIVLTGTEATVYASVDLAISGATWTPKYAWYELGSAVSSWITGDVGSDELRLTTGGSVDGVWHLGFGGDVTYTSTTPQASFSGTISFRILCGPETNPPL